jgi:hypothetical protein
LALALWADGDCREVDLLLSEGTDLDAEGEAVGPWVLYEDAPGCGNMELGNARCLRYRSLVDEGVLDLSMMGLTRSEGDSIALSIPP